jgi:hypothetical protein
MIPATFTYLALMFLELQNPYREYCYDSEMVCCEDTIYHYDVSGPGSRYSRYEIYQRCYWGDAQWPEWFDFYIILPTGELIDDATITRGKNYWQYENCVTVQYKIRKETTLWRIKIRNDNGILNIEQPLKLRIWSSLIVPKTKAQLDKDGKVIQTWRERNGVMQKEEGA